MSGTHLPFPPRRARGFRPYVFGVSIATAVIAWACLTGIAVGKLLDGAAGVIVGLAAVATVGVLCAGWAWQRNTWMLHGLLWSTGVWAAVATILAVDVGATNVNTLLAACFVVMSGGAWREERRALRGG